MNDTLRALFPVTERAIYLNHAAVSPPPTPTIEAIQSQLTDVSENGSVNFRRLARSQRTSARQLLAEHARRATGTGRFHAQHFRRAFDRREWSRLARGR